MKNSRKNQARVFAAAAGIVFAVGTASGTAHADPLSDDTAMSPRLDIATQSLAESNEGSFDVIEPEIGYEAGHTSEPEGMVRPSVSMDVPSRRASTDRERLTAIDVQVSPGAMPAGTPLATRSASEGASVPPGGALPQNSAAWPFDPPYNQEPQNGLGAASIAQRMARVLPLYGRLLANVGTVRDAPGDRALSALAALWWAGRSRTVIGSHTPVAGYPTGAYVSEEITASRVI